MDVILDGAKIQNMDDFHAEISKVLDFPAYYGKSPDALWDLLTSWNERPLRLIWLDHLGSMSRMGKEAELILKVFKRAEAEAPLDEI